MKKIFYFCFRFFCDLRLAVFLLLSLFLLTWLSTLEQVHFGLYETTKKYFSADSFFIIPQIGEKIVPLLLPNAYWVCLFLFFNLFLGGVFRLWKKSTKLGIFIAHCGVLSLLITGFVTHHFSRRGALSILEGETARVAKAYIEHSVEVKHLVNGEVVSVSVINENEVRKTTRKGQSILLPDFELQFDFEGYAQNAEILPLDSSYEKFTMIPRKPAYQAEENIPACIVKVSHFNGEELKDSILLSPINRYPASFEINGKIFVIAMTKKQWVLPFSLRLNQFSRVLYPATEKPKSFSSQITQFSEEGTKDALIEMNEPLRAEGITFFQASWGIDKNEGNRVFSVFEVVQNPADQWPLYSLCIIGFGLFYEGVKRGKKK